MTRILRNLRIDEISSVDKGAGEGTKILFMKQADAVSRYPSLREVFDAIDYSKLDIEPDDDDDDDIIDDEDPASVPDKMEQFAAILMAANPSLSREDAIYFLTHHAQGQATARYLAEVTKQLETVKEEPTMSKSEQLVEFIAKGGSISAVCKRIIDKGSTGVTEHDFTAMVTEYARLNKRDGETDAAAFSRVFLDDISIRKAHAICKATPDFMSIQPEQVGGADAIDVNNDSSKAMAKLNEMAEEQRKRSPMLTVAQCFARVFEDPANKSLAAAAHRRPTATTSFPMPTR